MQAEVDPWELALEALLEALLEGLVEGPVEDSAELHSHAVSLQV